MRNGVLFISSSSEDAVVVSRMLGAVAIPVQHAENLNRAKQKLDHEAYGVILTEAKFGDGKWEDVIELVEQAQLRTAVVVTDRLADARLWADALDLGAYDVLSQPFYPSEVQRVMSNALSAPADLRKTARAAL